MTREIQKYKITLEVESNFPGFANDRFVKYLKKYVETEKENTSFKILDWNPSFSKVVKWKLID